MSLRLSLMTVVFGFAHFFSFYFFSNSFNGNFSAAFHDLEISSDAWPNLRLNKWHSNNPKFESVGVPVSVSNFANRVPYASRAVMFKSVISSSQQISFTECDTGLPYRFAPDFLFAGYFASLSFFLPPDQVIWETLWRKLNDRICLCCEDLFRFFLNTSSQNLFS